MSRTRLSALGTESAVFSRTGPDGRLQRTDAISIALSEQGTTKFVWQLDVFADLESGGNVYVGQFWCVPSSTSGRPSRVVGSAVCPGAVKWHVNGRVVMSPNRQLVGAGGGAGFFAPTLNATVGSQYADLDIGDVVADLGAFAGVYPNTQQRYFRAGQNYVTGNPLPDAASGMGFANPGVFDGPIIASDPVPPSPLAQNQLFLFPCYLKQIFGSNEGGANAWLHIFDAVAVQGNGATGQKYIINIPAGATFSLDVRTEDGRAGDFFFNGLVWQISSTNAPLTVLAGSFNVQTLLGI